MENLARRAAPHFLLAAAIVLIGVSLAAAPHPSSRQNKNAKSARTVMTSDKGKFRILLDGQPAGSEEFEISGSGASWTARGSSTVHVPGSGDTKPMDVKTTGTLQLSGDGAPSHYEWTAEGQKKAAGSVDFKNAVAKTTMNLVGGGRRVEGTADFHRMVSETPPGSIAQITYWRDGLSQTALVQVASDGTEGTIRASTDELSVDKAKELKLPSVGGVLLVGVDEGGPAARAGLKRGDVITQFGTYFGQDFTFPTPRVAILDNNLYYQYAVLARLYDWKAAGQQNISVLIPQDGAPGEVAVESLGQQEVDGKKYDALRVRSTDLEILLYLDSQRRLMRLEVPSSKVIVERQ